MTILTYFVVAAGIALLAALLWRLNAADGAYAHPDDDDDTTRYTGHEYGDGHHHGG